MQAKPFLITSLPHSRTAWLSVLFSSGESICQYETISDLDTVDDLRGIWERDTHRYAGAADCALAWFLPWIMGNIAPRTLIVDRPVVEVDAALDRMGFARTDYCMQQMEQLRKYRQHPLVRWIGYDELDDEQAMRAATEHLTPGAHFDVDRFNLLKRMHIEVDIDKTFAKVQSRKANMARVLSGVMPEIHTLDATFDDLEAA
jgi:hypothetical protein